MKTKNSHTDAAQDSTQLQTCRTQKRLWISRRIILYVQNCALKFEPKLKFNVLLKKNNNSKKKKKTVFRIILDPKQNVRERGEREIYYKFWNGDVIAMQ